MWVSSPQRCPFQKVRDDKKASQTLVTPSAAVSLTVAAEPPAPPVAKPPPAPRAAEPSPAKPNVNREAAPKSDREESRKARTHESAAPSKSDKPREKTPPSPGRPKNVDFGI